MTETIRVLIADDALIVLEGWKAILATADDIRVVGEATSAPEAIRRVRDLAPDVVLMDLKWFGDETAGWTAIGAIKTSSPEVKVIAITAYEDLLDGARRAGADATLLKTFSRQELLGLIRTICREDKELSTQYVRDLAQTKPGRTDANAYEELMYEVLEFLTAPSLSNPRWQSRTWLGTRVRDAVFFNGSDRPFWQAIRTRHGSEYIVFELKNTAEIKPEHIDQLGSYLGRSLGHFGLLVGRHPPGESVWLRQVALYNNEDKVVLVMWDEHIRTMLSLKAVGVDPAEIIQDLYVEFKQRVQ